MKVQEFNYELPEELIAQVPIKNRDESRLMVLNRTTKTIEDKTFYDILDYLKPGDCLVRNNTKVIPARLYGIKEETNANIEFLLLKRLEGDIWEVMVHPRKKIKSRYESNFWRWSFKSRNFRGHGGWKSKSKI